MDQLTQLEREAVKAAKAWYSAPQTESEERIHEAFGGSSDSTQCVTQERGFAYGYLSARRAQSEREATMRTRLIECSRMLESAEFKHTEDAVTALDLRQSIDALLRADAQDGVR